MMSLLAWYFQELKEKLTSKECIVLADFAENYTFTIQDEIRSSHWNNNQQATINLSLRSNLSNQRNLSSNERSLNTSKSVTFYKNVGFPSPIQCEIIANELQKAYTEYVAFRFKKKMGILCNILFLEDKALLNRRIYDVAHQGGLYVVVINPQNEKHKSVTVNILQGTPQEHRNMPLEDALNLLAHNFHDHIRSQREYMERERTARGQYIGIVADREVQFLLRMLADGRHVSLSEMNIVIKYLTQRRDNMQTSYDVLFGKDSAFHIDPIIQIIKSEKPEIKKALETLMHNRPTF